VGNDNCVSFLQFGSEVVDSFKDNHKTPTGKLKNTACESKQFFLLKILDKMLHFMLEFTEPARHIYFPLPADFKMKQGSFMIS
jgi:hypothetical protein